MAPEQTEGARADVRSDIFSFGVMLYEMLTGVRPFDSNNVVSTIRRINDARTTPAARGAAGHPAGARVGHRQGA